MTRKGVAVGGEKIKEESGKEHRKGKKKKKVTIHQESENW